MQRLAQDYNFSFYSRPPHFLDFYTRILSGWQRGRHELNLIEGIWQGHKVIIYDKIHFFWNVMPRTTIVEINGRIVEGEVNFGFWDYLFPGFLTPGRVIRKILNNLKVIN